MYDERTFKDEKQNTLSDSDLRKVLDSILDFERKWNCRINGFAISGGDPLLRENWFEFLSGLKNLKKTIVVMGNPETLTTGNLKLLQEIGIVKFQLSLDGLEETHDKFRSKGSFNRTVEAIKNLEELGITTQIMFTLYPENKNELFSLIDFLAKETPLSLFVFDIGTSSGNANSLSKDFEAAEIKKILEKYVVKKKHLADANLKLKAREKSHLFELLHYEQHKDNVKHNPSYPVARGCLAGWNSISILSDGTVLSCRRLPIAIGKMPEQSFEEIFLGSDLLKKFRRRSYFEDCSACSLYQYCRGCPAYVYGATGGIFGKHPLCFKDTVNPDKNISPRFPEPGIDTSFEEEFKFIRSAFHFDEKYFFNKLRHDAAFRSLFLKIIDNRKRLKEFLEGNATYIKNNEISLSDYDILLLKNYMFPFWENNVFDRVKDYNNLLMFINKIKMFDLIQ